MFNPQAESSRISIYCPLYIVLCLVCCLASVAFSNAQQEETPQTAGQQKMPVFSIESAMVVVDLTVRDGKGNPIGDLKKEDFRVFEDNVPQDIVTFSAENVPIGPIPVKSEQAPGRKPDTPEASHEIVNLGLNPNEPPRKEDLTGKRLVILFFDLDSLGTENLIRSIDAAHDFVANQTGPQDLLAIATYSSALDLVQDFTNDRDLLLKTLQDITSVDSGDTESEDLSDASSSEDTFVPDNVQFNIFNTDRRLAAVESLAKMYRDFPERKSLIYFSGGVTTTGIENNAQIRSTVDNANRSNMSIYTVDSRGLVALPPGGDASQASAGGAMFRGAAMMRQRSGLSSSQETLTTLSYDTGGRDFTDSNDLSLAMEQVQEDTNIYYVIGYFSTNQKEDGKYRKIRVELKRPGLKIHHRPGYFAAKSFRRMNQQERDLQLQQAMTIDKPFVDIPVILEADCFRKDNNSVFVPLSIELDGDGLEFEEKGSNYEGKFEFVAQAVDAGGKIKGVARDAVSLKLPSDKAARIREGGIFYSTGFQLRPGDYKLKFLVRDNITGKLGSFEQLIKVPAFDLKSLEISSIVLGDQLADIRGDADSVVRREGAMRRFQEMGLGYDPLIMGTRKIVPSIGNVFLARQTVYVYFQVYGAAKDPETKKPCIATDLLLIRDNTKILETRPQYVQEWTQEAGFPRFGPGRGPGPKEGPPGMKGIEEREGESTVAITLPLRNLKKGTYTLQIHVHDTIAGVNRFERVPVVIQ